MIRGTTAVVTATLVCALLGASQHADAAVSPVISAGIDQNRDLSMTFADGTPIGAPQPSGTVIPPGTYTVNVNDDSDISNFDLTGPGVSFATSVDDFVQVSWTVTFQPCSLYSYQNDTVAGSNLWFQTSAQPTSTTACGIPALTAPTGATSTTSSPAGGSSPSGKTPTTPVSAKAATAKATFRGTLLASVSASAADQLTRKGKPVGTLISGLYTISVRDKSPQGGFLLQEIRKAATTVSGVAFVGKRSMTIDLAPGQWFFYSTVVGKKTYFIVMA